MADGTPRSRSMVANLVDICTSSWWPLANTCGLLVLAWLHRRRGPPE